MQESFLAFAAVGFAAQLVDGALGMAYGLTSTTFLLTLGMPPAAASASVHAAEVFTTGAAGISHLRLGNADMRLVRRLSIPGILGATTGAFLLTAVPGTAIRPFVAAYLAVLGCVLLLRGRGRFPVARFGALLVPLAAAGGFLDAVGGGGWGPIVASALLLRGSQPRFAIGSVSVTEFFVTAAQSIAFLVALGLVHLEVIAGLVVGGVVAAPLSALLCKRLPSRALLRLVGLLVLFLSARVVVVSLGL